MKSYALLVVPAVVFLFLAGCSGGTDARHGEPRAETRAIEPAKATPEEAATIATALSRLSPEDRTIAETQTFCAVEPENRLGLMGTPVKVEVQGKPVFLCCKGCKSTALAQPDKTLATVQQLKKTPETTGH